MKTTYTVKNIEQANLGTFDNYAEALELVLKLGDRSILAKIY
jgi:hypothetical protein